MYKMAVIGDKDSILGFKAIGLEVFPVVKPEDANFVINRLAKEDYAVIFITEPVAERVQEAISKYKTAPFPAIIPIPTGAGTTGLGMQGVRDNVEKAIGADIIFGGQ